MLGLLQNPIQIVSYGLAGTFIVTFHQVEDFCDEVNGTC